MQPSPLYFSFFGVEGTLQAADREIINYAMKPSTYSLSCLQAVLGQRWNRTCRSEQHMSGLTSDPHD